MYRFADLNIDIAPRMPLLSSRLSKYCTDSQSCDINCAMPDEIYRQAIKSYPLLSEEDAELMAVGYAFAYKLIKRGGFVLHASAIEISGKCFLFSAESGVGKSTHTAFLEKTAKGLSPLIINDDKPAMRNINGAFFAYGTPFSGTSERNLNIASPLGAIIFIEQGKENRSRRLSPADALPLLLANTLRPKDAGNIDILLSTLDALISSVPFYSLSAINDISAAEHSLKHIILPCLEKENNAK